ncbi:MAG: FAD-dependent oxidoreductase, partial [Rhodothermales bacterium]|nr:FAD-dependent oxidoreductase [Rhodothermales bacterium]
MESYDVIVIGSGQGGNPLAHTLADRGRRVALVEREHLGGTCVNYGCTPTKTMVASARIAHYARRAADFGVHAGPVTVDLAAVVRRKQQMVEQWRSGQQQAVDERQTLDLYRGHARFTGPHTLDVDGAALRSEQIVIDVGTRPRLPEIDGIDAVEVLTNRTILELTALPEHLLVLGGGYVGVEFAQMFRRFGSEVTILDRG